MKKKALLYIFFLAIIISSSGCATSKKPLENASPSPKILVPEVSTVSFDTVNIRNTPKPVQDVAKDMSGKDMATWLKVNNTSYILINQSKNTATKQVEIAEILRKIPVENYIWFQVTLNYKSAEGQENAFINEPLVAKFDLPTETMISGVGFDFEKLRNVQVTPKAQERVSPHTETGKENQDTVPAPLTLEITNPAPDSEVTAPFKITGRLKNFTTQNKEQLLVRLRDNTGQVIVEKPVASAQYLTDNSFEETMSYPALQNPEKGIVETLMFDRETGAEKNVVKIPVTLK